MNDDNEPATHEWMKSIGGYELPDGYVTVTKEVGYDSHVIGVKTYNFIGWVVWNSFAKESCVDVGGIGHNHATRGDVRRLCAAMQIPISETTVG